MSVRFRRLSRARLLVLGVVCAADEAFAQTIPPPTTPQQNPAPAPASQRLRVFLDCDCFQTYLRDEIDWVDYVRQAQDADVHLISRETRTGGGGGEIVVRF